MNKTIGHLAASIQPFVDERRIAGAVLLTGRNNEAPQIETIGFTDSTAQKPMQPDTLFWIASNSKQVTSAALMMLFDEGKLTLDDPVSKHLPEFEAQMFVAEESDSHKLLRAPARPPTVRDLVSHTSGVLPWARDGRLNAGTLSERAIACGLTPLRFEPGTRWEYGNGGFEAAGRIIEVLSGEPLDTFLQTRIFDPLGMADTTFWPTAAQVERLAVPSAPGADGTNLIVSTLPFTYPLAEMSGSPSPGGGLFSTASDGYLFCRLIASGGVFEGKRLLSEAAIRAMTTTQTGDLLGGPDHKSGYGLGWHTTNRDRGLPWPEGIGPVHHGGAHGTNFWIDPQTGQTKVFMIAQNGWPPEFDGGQVVQAFWNASAV